jgi:large subunit ribosomal protein L3
LEVSEVLGILGTKIGMTQIFKEDGSVVPVTVIKAGPCKVVQVKTQDTDGYNAVQIGYDDIPERKANKPLNGHFRKYGVTATRHLKEFRLDETATYKSSDQITVEIFEGVTKVDIRGISKGKGFQGVVKRWGFHGGRMTHGSMFHRRPGSIGACAYPSETLPGKKMPGHTGAKPKCIQNLEIVRIIPEKNVILVRGSVPGHINGLVAITPAAKVRKKKGGR